MGAASIPEPDVEIQASDYFGRRKVTASAAGKGTMQEVGATKVTVYEQQSDGTYKSVYTYT